MEKEATLGLMDENTLVSSVTDNLTAKAPTVGLTEPCTQVNSEMESNKVRVFILSLMGPDT